MSKNLNRYTQKEKFCENCKEYKHKNFFHLISNIDEEDVYEDICKKCFLLKAEELESQKSRKEQIDRQRGYNMKKYGIGVSVYNSMFLEQEGRCKICGIHQNFLKKSLYVDHCHKTNIVRGLLCHKCNTALGLLQEDSYIMKRMIKYIEK
jgi:uncharacterized protein YjaZ